MKVASMFIKKQHSQPILNGIVLRCSELMVSCHLVLFITLLDYIIIHKKLTKNKQNKQVSNFTSTSQHLDTSVLSTFISILQVYFFRQITTFIKVREAFVFGLQTLSIELTKIYQLKGLKPINKGYTNFYECCDLTEKVYLVNIYNPRIQSIFAINFSKFEKQVLLPTSLK